MTEKPFLSGYDGQTLDELLALEDRYRIDSLVLAVEEALQDKELKAGDAALSEPEQVVLAIEALEREVNNGGYSQFFVNYSRRYAARVVADLEAIGCPATASVTKDAIAALAIDDLSPEAIEDRIFEADDSLDDKFQACGQAYHATGEDIEGRLFEYIRANKGSIDLASGS